MKRNRWTKFAAWSLAAGLLCALATTPARAQSEASAALSLLPVALAFGVMHVPWPPLSAAETANLAHIAVSSS